MLIKQMWTLDLHTGNLYCDLSRRKGAVPLYWKGNYAGYWAIDVSGNWRVVFRFEGVNVYDVELTDYH